LSRVLSRLRLLTRVTWIPFYFLPFGNFFISFTWAHQKWHVSNRRLWPMFPPWTVLLLHWNKSCALIEVAFLSTPPLPLPSCRSSRHSFHPGGHFFSNLRYPKVPPPCPGRSSLSCCCGTGYVSFSRFSLFFFEHFFFLIERVFLILFFPCFSSPCVILDSGFRHIVSFPHVPAVFFLRQRSVISFPPVVN